LRASPAGARLYRVPSDKIKPQDTTETKWRSANRTQWAHDQRE